jgi:Phosphofructokinase
MLIPSPMTADSIVRGSLLRDSDMYLRMKGSHAPGMNAATRAVVRAAVARGFTVAGIRDDYTGLIATDIHWRVQ